MYIIDFNKFLIYAYCGLRLINWKILKQVLRLCHLKQIINIVEVFSSIYSFIQ